MLPFIQALPDDPDQDQGQRKATLDESDIGAPPAGEAAGRASQKVELDLEDAPFLEEDEEAEVPVEEPVAPEPEKPKTSEAPSWRKLVSKKNVLLASVGLVLLVATGIGLKVFVFDHPAEAPREEAEEAPAHEAPPPEEVTEVNRTVRLDPFWVEKTDDAGVVHFLRCRFALVTADPAAVREIDSKRLVLRDALYYYLRNKNFDFLADMKNMEALKKDLLSVLNKFIGADQLDTILIEEYLVK